LGCGALNARRNQGAANDSARINPRSDRDLSKSRLGCLVHPLPPGGAIDRVCPAPLEAAKSQRRCRGREGPSATVVCQIRRGAQEITSLPFLWDGPPLPGGWARYLGGSAVVPLQFCGSRPPGTKGTLISPAPQPKPHHLGRALIEETSVQPMAR